jgi:hypothetical protein
MNYEKMFAWEALETSLSFDQLMDYFKMMEKAVASIEKEYEGIVFEKIAEIEAEAEPEGEFEFREHQLHQEHFHRFEDAFPRQISYSFIVLLFARIESNFKSLSEFIRDQNVSPVTIFDFDGDIPEKLRKYKQVNDSMKIDESGLRAIKEISKIRNCIVHNFGKIKPEEASLLRYCKANKAIQISRGNEIKKIEIQWCYKNLQTIQSMFTSIYLSLGYTRSANFDKLKSMLRKA